MKTFKDWKKEETIAEYLQIGDIVDNEMYEHFLNILPPITSRNDMLQVGGMIDVEKDENGVDKPTYITFTKDTESNGWVYRGECFVNGTINKNPNLKYSKEYMSSLNKEKRIFEHYKNRLINERVIKDNNIRFPVIEYLCQYPQIAPIEMAKSLVSSGYEITFDDSSISKAENDKKRFAVYGKTDKKEVFKGKEKKFRDSEKARFDVLLHTSIEQMKEAFGEDSTSVLLQLGFTHDEMTKYYDYSKTDPKREYELLSNVIKKVYSDVETSCHAISILVTNFEFNENDFKQFGYEEEYAEYVEVDKSYWENEIESENRQYNAIVQNESAFIEEQEEDIEYEY